MQVCRDHRVEQEINLASELTLSSARQRGPTVLPSERGGAVTRNREREGTVREKRSSGEELQTLTLSYICDHLIGPHGLQVSFFVCLHKSILGGP